jgi:hypothetical protein
MPLRDHFHGETETELPWPTMAQAWAVSLMGWLNRTLPKDRFQALADVRTGALFEADVAEYRRDDTHNPNHGPNGSVATLAVPVAPPAVLTVSAIFADEIEVEIRERRAGRELVGVIELVSPGNKDRSEACESFVAKCVTYLTSRNWGRHHRCRHGTARQFAQRVDGSDRW